MSNPTADREFSIIYSISVAIECWIELNDDAALRLYVKPLVIVLLINYLFYTLWMYKSNFKKLILASLVLSLIGDISMLFEKDGEIYFMVGLGSFLIAHAVYIIAFLTNCGFFKGLRQHPHPHTALESNKVNQFIVFGALPFYSLATGFYLYIRDGLGDIAVPVVIYMIILASMGAASALRVYFTTYRSFIICVFGAIIFMVSDIIMALRKFKGVENEYTSAAINFTYFVAQYMFVLATVEHVVIKENHLVTTMKGDSNNNTTQDNKKSKKQ